MNSKTMYFINNRKNKRRFMKLKQKFALDLCYEDEKEKIYRNSEMILSYKKRYIYAFVYDEESVLVNKLKEVFYKG